MHCFPQRQIGGRLLLPFFLLAAQPAWACYAPPRQQLVGVDEQISEATRVALVKVVAASGTGPRGVIYELVVQKHLAGWPRTRYTIAGDDGGRANDTSFDHHTDPAFWQHGGGRLMNDTDCVIHPSFVVGHTYLLFGDGSQTWRGAEKIEMVNGEPDPSDKWLQYVEAGLRQRIRFGQQ